MKYLAVDDEEFALQDLVETLKKIEPSCQVDAFTSPLKALRHAGENPVEVAFLDVEMGSTTGLLLAKKLKDILPDIHIIFVTGHEQYAVAAFQIHATGYLLKPVTEEDLRRELTFIYGAPQTRQPIRVRTFGGFDIFMDGKPLVFSRSKSKELLAYLIDRHGASVTMAEACVVLWEDDSIDEGKKGYLRTLIADLRKTLKKAGIEELLIKTFNSLAIRPEMLDCDSYRFLEGQPEAVNTYRHDYMPSYSWAEFTMGELESLFYYK